MHFGEQRDIRMKRVFSCKLIGSKCHPQTSLMQCSSFTGVCLSTGLGFQCDVTCFSGGGREVGGMGLFYFRKNRMK